MSFNFSLAQLKNLSNTSIIIIGLLVVHTLWIVTHLNLVARDYINPWKLGGYGMYTKPNAKPKLRLYDIRSKPKRISKKTYKSKRFRNANLRYVVRCRPISEKAFAIFLEDNPHLVNVDLKFMIRERRFSRDPVGVKWVPHSIAELKWPKKDRFTYSGEVCGKKYVGESEYKS